MVSADIMPAPPVPGPAARVKRKRDSQRSDEPNKKQHTGPSTPHIPRSLPMQPHEAVLAELRPKYDILTLSVISSSKIEQRVGRVLAHLGRFHPTDMDVLPGLVLMHARSHEAAKMISIIEIVRRRVQESGNKWYQYNRLYEVDEDDGPSVVEDTVMMNAAGASEADDEADEDDDFETMPSRFREAVGESSTSAVTTKPYMSIVLSRVPILELRTKDFITEQSSEGQVQSRRRTQDGTAWMK